MANTRKSATSSDTLLARVSAVIEQRVPRSAAVTVGLSGGVDSVVLFDLLRRLSRKLGFGLAAIHVDHRINPASGCWAAFCRKLCRVQGVPCKVVRVTVARGDSLEAAARAARYRVFTAARTDFIALAHNLDDQAETVLLQLLRGAGVKGLAAMPVLRIEDRGSRIVEKRSSDGRPKLNPQSSILNPAFLRPLLDVPRSEIVAYARKRRLRWIEDGSNADRSFDRNFLRHEVLPVIERRYPAYRAVLARSGRNLAEASLLLDELGAADSKLTRQGISLSALKRLSPQRAKNALRYFLARNGMAMPNAVRLEEFVRQVMQAKRGTRFALDLGTHRLLRFSDELRLSVAPAAPPCDFVRGWKGERALALEELGGTLRMKRSRGAGISLARLRAAPVTVRLRHGGEHFQPDARRPRRSLKNLLREAGVPPWMRANLPLLYSGTSLVYVPGIGIASAYRAARDEPGVEPQWNLPEGQMP